MVRFSRSIRVGILYICMSVDVVVQKYHYHSENTAQGFIKYAVNFPQVRLHLSNAKQKIAFLFCIAFGLH